MRAKVQKWGNSQGVRVPKTVLEQARIAVGDEVEISVSKGRIVVKRSTPVRGRYQLKDLLERIPVDYRAEETDWGTPIGREAW
jgi:antitoxin MazE